jgi:hypothetical protein
MEDPFEKIFDENLHQLNHNFQQKYLLWIQLKCKLQNRIDSPIGSIVG